MRFACLCLICCLAASPFRLLLYVDAAVPALTIGVKDIGAGAGYSLLLESNGTLFASGSNTNGQLGDGTGSSRSDFVSVATGVSFFSCGGNHVLFVRTDGSLWGMGNNYSGQLGDGTRTNSLSPKQLLATGVASASAGENHSLYVKTDGSLWATGMNITGQLGDGNYTDLLTPVQVVSSGVSLVSAGGNHSLFVKTDGSLWAMGSGWAGALGDGNTTSRPSPVQVVASGVASISAGGNHSLFVKTDGSLWAMGFNYFGQLGDDSTTNRLTPVQVLSAGVSEAWAGENHSLYLKTDGSLWGMGNNGYGQLGDGTTTSRSAPVQLVSSVVLAAAGSYHSLHLTSGRSVKATGENVMGALGDGSTQNRTSPVTVRERFFAVTMSEDGSPTAWAAPPVAATDADGVSGLTWSVGTGPVNGVAAVTGAGASPTTFTYAPNTNYSGQDSFTVKVSDGTATDEVTVKVTVEAVNDAPVIAQSSPQAVTMNEGGSPVAWTAPTLTASDAEGSALTWYGVDAPSNGTLTVYGNSTSPSTLTYLPDANFSGQDSFSVGVTDGSLESVPFTVNVTVSPVNKAPVITQGDDALSVLMNEGQSLSGSEVPALAATDPDANATLTWSVSTPPAYGSVLVSGQGASPATFTITPDADYYGDDSFVVMVSDGDANDTITVNLAISAVNDAPVVAQGSTLSTTMSENGSPVAWSAPTVTATDADGDSVTWSLLTSPANGSATVSGTGASPSIFNYVPRTDFDGNDSFVIRATDGLESVDLTVMVTVLNVNAAPVIGQGESLSVSISEDGSPTVWSAPTITATDLDANDTLTWSVATAPNKGTVSVTVSDAGAASTVTYVPQADVSGNDSFVLRVSDGAAYDDLTFNVTILPVNDTPVVSHGASVSVTMSKDDAPMPWSAPALTATDADGDPLAWSLFAAPTNGTATVSGTGSAPEILTYAPNLNYVGTDAFTLQVTDGNASATVVVNVTVQPVNEPPVVSRGVTQVAAGEGFSFYLEANGSLYASGRNDKGQLGDGSGTDRAAFVHVASGVKSVSAGESHVLFLKTDGSLWATGSNESGQLGDGSTTDRVSPVQAVASGVSSVAAGGSHSLFVKTDGSLWATGANESGQLGDGSAANRSAPVQVVAAGVAAAYAGKAHSLFLKTDGSLWAMGKNASGQLGDGLTQDRSSSVQVFSEGISSAAAGGDFSLFVKDDGSLWSVGDNAYGQLGDGTRSERVALHQVAASGVASASAGLDGTTFFVKANGSLHAIGNNIAGQFGNGTTTDANASVQTLASGVSSASVGSDHTLIVKRDGSLLGAGGNLRGGLGDGSTTNRSSFVEIDDGSVYITISEDASPVAWSAPDLVATDSTGDALTWSLTTAPSNGTATVSGTGASPSALNYVPAANYNGADSFVIQVSDGASATLVKLKVNALAVADAPVIAQGDSVSVTMSEEGSPAFWSTPVLTASDAEGDALTWSLAAAPANGTAEVNGAGATPSILNYAPATNFAGTDSFVVQVSDGNLTDLVTVNVTVNNVNDAPVLSANFALSVTMSEDGAPLAWVAPNLTATDPDAGSALFWSLASAPTNGTAVVSGTGSTPSAFSYAPNANVYGTDSFTVRVSDGTLTDEVAVNVIIVSVADAPVITQGSALTLSMSEDGAPTAWPETGLSATDPDGATATLTWSLQTIPTHGTAAVNGTGASPATFSYAPAPNWFGSDSFVVSVSDGAFAATATVNVNVSSVNDVPVITQGASATVTMSEDGAPVGWVAPALSATDVEGAASLVWSVSVPPSNGVATVAGIGASPATFTYVPSANFTGTDSFTVQVSDGQAMDACTVNVNVSGVNDVPVITQGDAVSATMSEDGLPIAWSAPTLTGSDPDGGASLVWSLASVPSNGTASVSGTGFAPSVFTYAPTANWSGSDSFQVRLSDGNQSDLTTVNITVLPVNDPPEVAQGSSLFASMSEDGTPVAWVAPALSASDPEGAGLSWSLGTAPSNGIATVNGTGASPATLHYAPNPNFSGADSFVVNVSDGSATDAVTINVSVQNLNDAPSITQGAYLSVTMSEDGAPTAWSPPSLSATDPDGTSNLAWRLATFPLQGSAQVSGTGSFPTVFTYVPAANWSGTDAFVVEVNDGVTSDYATVSVKVEPVADVPVIGGGANLSVSMSVNADPVPWNAPSLVASDADADAVLTWSVASAPATGVAVVSGTGPAPSVLTYSPPVDFVGTTQFVVQVSDGNHSDQVDIQVKVLPYNTPPVIDQGTTLRVTVSEDSSPTAWSAPTLTATDLEGDLLTWSLQRAPVKGTAVVSGSGKSPATFSYLPNTDYHGADSFVVQVTDGAFTDLLTVNLTVESVNDLPAAPTLMRSGYLYENYPAGTLVGAFSTTDADHAGGPHVFSLVSEANGSTLQNPLFSLDANGTLKTIAPLDFETTPNPSVRVRATDPAGGYAEKTFALSVTDLYLPVANTFAASDLTATTAMLKGAVEDAGDDPRGVTSRGFVLGRLPDPAAGESGVLFLSAGSGSGSFTASASSLVPGRVYYYRAFATNSEGTRYGPQRRFLTSEQRSLGPWADATNASGNWWTSDWFGSFYATDSDWFYHAEFGWLYVSGSDPENLWLWNNSLGWVWTSKTAFPYLYSAKISDWLLWKKTTGSDSVFFDYSSSQWTRRNLRTEFATSASYK